MWFSKECCNKTWVKLKLLNFECFRLYIDELLYYILNKMSYERLYAETKLSILTYSRIKKKIREIIKKHFEKQGKLAKMGLLSKSVKVSF